MTAEAIAAHLTYLNPGGRFDELAEAVVDRGHRAPRAAEPGRHRRRHRGDVRYRARPHVRAPTSPLYYAGSPRWLARTGAAVVLVDHVTKSQEGRGRWAIGSERKLWGLDGAAYGFESLVPFGRGKTGLVKITVAKDRCGHIRQQPAPAA